MKLRLIGGVVAALLGMTIAGAASAAELDFSYVLSTGNTLSGELSGGLESDQNTFDIASVIGFSVNGTSVQGAFTVQSLDHVAYNLGIPFPNPAAAAAAVPTFTLDGSRFDTYFFDSTGAPVAVFAKGDQYAALVGASDAGALSALGGDGSTPPFVAANYTAQIAAPAVSAAPEPGAWALMLGGVAAIGLMVRRRRTAAVTA